MTTGLVKVRSHNVNGILNPIKREGMSWWGGRFEGSEFTLFNVYAPLGANWYFVRHTFNLMLTKAQGLMICGGDINVRLSSKLDSSWGSSPPDSSLSRKINFCKSRVKLMFAGNYIPH